MNYGLIKTLLISTIIFYAFSACTPMRKMVKNVDEINVRVNPDVLEVKNDTISFDVVVSFPKKYVSKTGHLIVNPVFSYGNRQYQMESFYVLGENSDFEVPGQTNRKRTISHKEGGNIRFSEKIPFQQEMMTAILSLDLNIREGSKYAEHQKCHDEILDSVRVGVITTPLRVVDNEDILMGGELTHELITEVFYIYFDIQSSVIRPAVGRGEEMKRMREFVKKPRLNIQNVSVNTYASPDGPIKLNERLSKDRMDASYAYISRELRRMGVDAIHDTQFLREFTWEDWMGFKRLVQESDLENKDQILSLINDMHFLQQIWDDVEKAEQKTSTNGGTPTKAYTRARVIDEEDYKEQLNKVESQIREFEKDWADMAENIFPQLRRAEIKLHGYFTLRSLEDIMSIGKENIDDLYKREVLNYAHYTEDINEKEHAYKHYMNKWEDDWVGYNNVAVLKLRTNHPEYEDAIRLLHKAEEVSSNEKVVLNNLGVAYAYSGDYETALNYFNKAQKAGADTRNNLGILNIRMGDYNTANGYFEGIECDHNAALALTLTANHQKALERLDCIVDKTADNFYLRAIIAARINDIELLNTSLTRSIQKDPSYRQLAQKDVEFNKYRNDVRFQNAIR